mgnify:FL=1
MKSDSCLCFSNQISESFLIGNCDLSKHLSIEFDSGFLQTVHKGGVVHTVYLALCGNTSDPQRSEISLLLLSADVCVVTALHYGLLSHLEVLGLGAPVTLSCLQNFISSFARHHRALNSCHLI